MEFQDECQTCGVWIALLAPEHQEMNGQVELSYIMLCMIIHSLMVHVQVLEDYIHFTLIYMEVHIFLVLPIKELINKDRGTTTSFKLVTGKKHSVSHLRVLFFSCVVQKATAHAGTKALNLCHKVQKGFRGIFIGIPQHKKGYLVYVPQKRKIIYSYNIIFLVLWSTRNNHIKKKWL